MPLEADGSAAEMVVNTSAMDVLRRLPGVTEGNYRALMQAAGSHHISDHGVPEIRALQKQACKDLSEHWPWCA